MSYRLRLGDLAALAFIIAGLAILAFSAPAHAQSSIAPDPPKPACAYVLDTVIPSLQADPSVVHFVIIDKPEMVTELVAGLKAAGEDVPDSVTRILIAQIFAGDGTQKVKYGLEVAGCLAPPTLWPGSIPSPFPAAERMSGRTPEGIGA